MGVQDGQDVSAAITNPAFINKNIDDSTPSRLGLGSTASDQGPAITWAQQQFNAFSSQLGIAINLAYNSLPSWATNYVGAAADTFAMRIAALCLLFSGNPTFGHTHTGTDGSGPQVNAASLVGTLPIANGGTGATTKQAAFDALAPTTSTTGQLIQWNGSHWVAVTLASGGGGGGSLQWLEISNSPEAVYANGALVYAYASELEQVLNCAIKVPSGYVAGSPIKLLMPFYDPDSSGRILFQTIATLIRTGVDAITSTTNQRMSTNSSVTLGSGTVNIPQAILFDLSDSVGKVNSVAVSPGDILLIALTLNGSSTGASPANAMVYETEVTFS
jgi:hypothetical protein